MTKIQDSIWEYVRSLDIKPKTFANYTSLIRNHIEPTLDSMDVPDLEYLDVMDLKGINKKHRSDEAKVIWQNMCTRMAGCGVSKALIGNACALINSWLKWLEDNYHYRIGKADPPKAIPASDRQAQWPTGIGQEIINLPANAHPYILHYKLHVITCWRISDLFKLNSDHIRPGTFDGKPVYWLDNMSQKTAMYLSTPVPKRIINLMMAKGYIEPGKRVFDMSKELYRSGIRNLLRDERNGLNCNVPYLTEGGEISQLPIWKVKDPSHQLRKAGVNRYLSMGVPASDVAELFTGHRDLSTLNKSYRQRGTRSVQAGIISRIYTDNDQEELLQDLH